LGADPIAIEAAYDPIMAGLTMEAAKCIIRAQQEWFPFDSLRLQQRACWIWLCKECWAHGRVGGMTRDVVPTACNSMWAFASAYFRRKAYVQLLAAYLAADPKTSAAEVAEIRGYFRGQEMLGWDEPYTKVFGFVDSGHKAWVQATLEMRI